MIELLSHSLIDLKRQAEDVLARSREIQRRRRAICADSRRSCKETSKVLNDLKKTLANSRVLCSFNLSTSIVQKKDGTLGKIYSAVNH